MSGTLMLLVLAIASPDAGLTREQAQAGAREAALDIDAEALLSAPAGVRRVISAMRCEAQSRVEASGLAIEAAIARRDAKGERFSVVADSDLTRAFIRAEVDFEYANTALWVLGVEPLACTSSDVAPLVTCLGVLSPPSCSSDPGVRAAEMLTEARMPKPSAPDL
jgi:hypothetical protein